MTDNTGMWNSLERWRSLAFLAPGVGFLLVTINAVLILVANTGMNLSPLVHLGLVLVAYVGLLGLSPRLVERAPRLGRVCQVFVLIVGVEIVLTFAVGLLPSLMSRPLFAVTVAMGVLGSALTMTVFGATTLWTRAYSRRVGGFLLLAAVGLSIVIVKALLFGDVGGPQWVPVVDNGIVGLSLIAVGGLLRTESEPTEQTEAVETGA
jgi:FtsH-binding integral membrane protein